MNDKNEGGFFETILFVVGLITGGLVGFEQGEWMGAIFGAVILGAVGKWVGTLTDYLIKFLVLVALILLNTAVRQFIWSLVREGLNAS